MFWLWKRSRVLTKHGVQLSQVVETAKKHYGIRLWNGKFLKLDRFENRIKQNELRKYLVKYARRHAYASVLSRLFPERGPAQLTIRPQSQNLTRTLIG